MNVKDNSDNQNTDISFSFLSMRPLHILAKYYGFLLSFCNCIELKVRDKEKIYFLYIMQKSINTLTVNEYYVFLIETWRNLKPNYTCRLANSCIIACLLRRLSRHEDIWFSLRIPSLYSFLHRLNRLNTSSRLFLKMFCKRRSLSDNKLCVWRVGVNDIQILILQAERALCSALLLQCWGQV